MHETIDEQLRRSFYDNMEIKGKLQQMEELVKQDSISSFVAAGELFDLYSKIR